jgi:hypothetical protein
MERMPNSQARPTGDRCNDRCCNVLREDVRSRPDLRKEITSPVMRVEFWTMVDRVVPYESPPRP